MSPTDPAQTPDGPDTHEAIARELDRLRREVQQLADTHERNELVDRLFTGLRRLDERQQMLAELIANPGGGEPPASRAWLLQVGGEPADLVERLTSLVEWVDKVFLRYPAATLPSCWLWHAWLVEELLWLQTYHGEAYGPRGTGVQQGMWHDQSLPNLIGRIQKHGGCDLAKHVPGGQAAKDPVAAPLAGHLSEVAAAWATTGLPPEPTSEQLEDARRHKDLRLQRDKHVS